MKHNFFPSYLDIVAIAIFVAAVIFQNSLSMGNNIFQIALLSIAMYLLYKLFLKPKRVVLFDFGGVVAEGDYFTQPLKIRKGIPELVGDLKRKNYEVALLTNQNGAVQDCLDKKFGLPKIFPTRIVSGKIGYKKPDPRIYKFALNIMNVMPENAYFIDDQAENIEGAKKVGIKAIHFKSVEQISQSIP